MKPLRVPIAWFSRWAPWALGWLFGWWAQAADYPGAIKPLLRDRCYACHGALKQKAGLRLDTVDFMRRGGESGPAVLPDRPDDSPLLKRVGTTDPEDRMPPLHEGEPLSADQQATLRDWIAAGAPAPANEKPEADPRDHWAFRPRVRPPVPSPVPGGWGRNPIDAFIAEGHRQHGVRPVSEASRPLLVRRLYLDQLGIPPSADDLARWTGDPGLDWYERLVDRLLDDPRHGERWARHWMDIWRYSDPWGLGDQHRNSQKHLWHWRDWIIESINRDLPYDEMVRRMLAADELHPTDLEQVRATGFLARNYFLFNRHQWLDETVEHVGKAFLGLTLNCAKCHDHKYDPVAQTDYYRFRAFFEPYHARLDVLPGEPDLNRDGLPRVYDRDLETPTYRFVRGQETQPDKSRSLEPGVPDLLAFRKLEITPVSLPVEAWQPERRPWVIDAHLRAADARVAAAQDALISARQRSAPENKNADSAGVRESELRVAEAELAAAEADRQAVGRRGEAMRAEWSGPSPGADPARQGAVRAERELAAARARVTVAQAELKLARQPTGQTSDAAKELSSAREKLADAERRMTGPVSPGDTFTRLTGAAWTPTRFLDSTKDDPSVPYASTSTGRRSALAAWITDPQHPLTARVAVNHLWTRHFGTPLVGTVFDFGRKGALPTHPELLDWLATELVDHGWSLKHLHRLLVTSATYRLESSVAGAEDRVAVDADNRWWWRRTPIRLESQAVRDSLLAHAGWLDPRLGGPPVAPPDQAASRRRSLYFQHSNNDRNLFLTVFDEAAVKECYRREQSVVPQQALALLNSRLVQDAAPAMVDRLEQTAPGSGDEAFVRHAFAVLLGYEPGGAELAETRRALASWQARPAIQPTEPVSRRARVNLVWALLNHTDFITLR